MTGPEPACCPPPTTPRPAKDIVELALRPTGPGIAPRAGQFVFLRVGGNGDWHEHPFSVASAGPGGELRLSVRALGGETRNLYSELAPGLPARVNGPYGMFDLTVGGENQAWMAASVS